MMRWISEGRNDRRGSSSSSGRRGLTAECADHYTHPTGTR
jgi:hypothetical protein